MAWETGFAGAVEFAPHFRPRKTIAAVLFDFDGTLSLIRRGWPEVMLPMFLEMLPRRAGVSSESDERMLRDDMMTLNGRQTIYQMMRLAERIRERGGRPHEPLWYKREYLRRLNKRIRSRLECLERGTGAADAFLVFGARRLLAKLQSLGRPMYLASGTDEPFVRREAALLGIADYFEGRICGALDDYRAFSKKMVIERILRGNRIAGESLLSFGDGYVEIENTKAVGGLAVAVASDEANNGSGNLDAWKRERLRSAGADVVIPDYRDSDCLLEVLWDRH